MQEATYKTRREASKYISDKGLPCAYSFLGKLASVGGGPRFHKFGKLAVYTIEDLDEWIVEKLGVARKSTTS